MAPFGAAPDRGPGGGLPGRFKFSKLHPTCYFVFAPIQHRFCVFCVFIDRWAKAQSVCSRMSGGHCDTGTGQGGGNLESGILSNRHRDVAQAGKPDGHVRAAGRSTRNGAMRPRRMVFAAFAPIAGAAAAARAERVPPPLPSDVHPGLQPAPTTGAAGVLWLDASQPLPVDQTAIDNIIMLRRARWGPRWRRRKDRLPRPASLGETVAIRPFSP